MLGAEENAIRKPEGGSMRANPLAMGSPVEPSGYSRAMSATTTRT